MKMEKRIKGITGYPRRVFSTVTVTLAHRLYLVHFRVPLGERFYYYYCSVMPQPHSGPHGRHD